MSKVLHIDYNVRVSEKVEGDTSIPYDSFTTRHTSVYVNGLYRKEVETFGESLKVFDDVFNMDKAYLVTVRYATGSTFGREYGCYKFLGIFKTLEEAEAVSKAIKDNGDRDSGGDYTIKSPISNPEFKDEIIYCDWVGYFERLEDVEIECFHIDDSKL